MMVFQPRRGDGTLGRDGASVAPPGLGSYFGTPSVVPRLKPWATDGRPYLPDICLTASLANKKNAVKPIYTTKKAVGPMFRKADPDHMLSRSTTYVRISGARKSTSGKDCEWFHSPTATSRY